MNCSEVKSKTNIQKEQSLYDRNRYESFLRVFERFFSRYEFYLKSREELDFADLIKLATEKLNKNEVTCNFSHIIVDEFQDISRGRGEFLKAVRNKKENCKLMCVGDDWQSIYGFTE